MQREKKQKQPNIGKQTGPLGIISFLLNPQKDNFFPCRLYGIGKKTNSKKTKPFFIIATNFNETSMA